MNARDAAAHLYTLAKSAAPRDADAIAVLLDHCRKLEQTIDAAHGALAARSKAPAPAGLDWAYGR
jgi:hypothetical protein